MWRVYYLSQNGNEYWVSLIILWRIGVKNDGSILIMPEIIIMHECNCCSTCQYDLNTLRTRYDSIVIDYTTLKDRMKLLACNTETYKQ